MGDNDDDIAGVNRDDDDENDDIEDDSDDDFLWMNLRINLGSTEAKDSIMQCVKKRSYFRRGVKTLSGPF